MPSPKSPPPGPILLGVTGIATFLATLLVIGSIAVQRPFVGFGVGLAGVLALFAKRARGDRSPLLGAAANGAAVAIVLIGGCVLIVHGLATSS